MVKLYGGAMECSIPKDFIDLSKLRQIPNHQEVFVTTTKPDISIIFELNQYQSHINNNESLDYFYNDLKQANQAISSSCLEKKDFQVNNIHQCNYSAYYIGTQKMNPNDNKLISNEQKTNDILIMLGVIRLPSLQTDILIQFNTIYQQDLYKKFIIQFQHLLSTFQLHDSSIFK